jgi:hypothetical protein
LFYYTLILMLGVSFADLIRPARRTYKIAGAGP